jgi:hypothetical protein
MKKQGMLYECELSELPLTRVCCRRTRIFYQIYITTILTSLIGSPIAFLSLNTWIWLPYLLCCCSLSLSFPILLYMPETSRLTQPSLHGRERSTALDTLGSRIRKSLLVYRKLLLEWKVLLGLIVIFTAQFRSHVTDLLFPYTSKRFGWSIAEVYSSSPSIRLGINIIHKHC